MSNKENDIVNEVFYEEILNNEGFINDLWNRYGVTDKLSTLQKSGWSMDMIVEEYIKANDTHSKDQQIIMDDLQKSQL